MEGAVIVASILLALAADAWGDERQDRSEERRAVLALAQDFEVAAERLESQVLIADSIRVAADLILEWTAPEAESRDADSLGTLLNLIERTPTFRPPLGTLDALLGSGDLGLIRNDSLRAALASFPSRLATMNSASAIGTEQLLGGLGPLLARSIPMRRFALGGDGQTAFTVDIVGLLRSFEFENQVQGRITNMWYLTRIADDMAATVESIRSMLALELDR